MTDSNANPLPRPNTPGRVAARTSIPPSSSSYGSYDTGEPSTAANQPYDTSVDSTSFRRTALRRPPDPSPDPQSVHHEEQSRDHDTHRRLRLPKPRPSGGFLLSNNILGQSSSLETRQRDGDRRKSRIPVDSRTAKSPFRSSEHRSPSESTGPRITLDEKESTKAPPALVSSGADAREKEDRPHSQMALRRRSMIPSPRPSSAPLDVDSNQIVSMALDLSESRRLASRRNISTPNPPRLVQLPDTTAGRSLKQHLQQQRRTSRNISPRADRILSPRIVSAPRISSPLQPAFEHDGSYTYHFSASTLDRAQRAKKYLELMAQYRRLFSFLPPLKQNTRSRPSTANPLTSPNSTGSPRDPVLTSQNQVLGRPYNPLQYIRNRKIRTRERKVIDGEAQGFGDIIKTTDWVDQVASFAAVSPTTSRRPSLPPFSAADEHLAQQLPASSLPMPVSTLTKPKRPRFDWSIDPADMLADVYWLEQDNNRYLIEDRHFTKIYTPETAVSQPIVLELEPSLAVPAHIGNPEANDSDLPQQDINRSTNTDIDTTLSSRRYRARQKLQDLRAHHRHSYSTHSHHDFLRLRRSSSSDSSDNESDRRRRGRTGTISASGKDLLEKQMNDMLAKESQDEQELVAGVVNHSRLKPLPAGISAPEGSSQISHLGHRRTKSHMQGTQQAGKALTDKPTQTPPLNSPRASLEVPSGPYRSSLELDSPRPPVSDVVLRGRQNGWVPAIGMDLSPTVSRPNSPARKPFSKVKSIFRDRSRDREENDDRVSSPVDLTETPSISQIAEDAALSIQPIRRQRSKSSTREFALRAAHESHKSHRSVGSLSLRPDEQIGLRTIFKGGAKLDDMIRGGVSKMTDLIWKKDSDSSDSSDDDSDTDYRRGRPTKLSLLSPVSSTRHDDSRRPAKNYMDIMPNFKSTTDSMDRSVSQNIDTSLHPVSSRPPSRSPRFDQLKPPRIDIRKASPEASELEDDNDRHPREFIDPTSSETDSYFHDSDHLINRPRQTSKELQHFHSRNNRESSVSHLDNGPRVYSHRNWVIPDLTSLSQHALISRREVARLRTLILCSGIKAMEISRRANEPLSLFGSDNMTMGLQGMGLNRFVPDEKRQLHMPQTELFPATAGVLSHNIDRSIDNFEKSASEFSKDVARLQHQVDMVHNRVAVELMDMTHHAADEADELSLDLVDYQRLKVEDAVNTIDNMLRQRRRRFRWVRRAGWLAVEWVLVGFMWYVWFIVMITRIILGAGRGVVSVIRWLLWI
ncbi:hypothetical protein F5B22DRAFT_427991 [Xylaria bambusicola]|uniref:uncharacterized protein n=1 Tax=Xylaria bambusicola TaxID=326684 RepID=UPI002007930B|nr:uncharacterized protein F5B22DRAFT_427991 [Xylaria bambusicola]KAI0506915.1 hypothetical protein F5B22DRAFT_427991 [Xylaria bambusicola]